MFWPLLGGERVYSLMHSKIIKGFYVVIDAYPLSLIVNIKYGYFLVLLGSCKYGHLDIMI